jgi:hypothetical protein
MTKTEPSIGATLSTKALLYGYPIDRTVAERQVAAEREVAVEPYYLGERSAYALQEALASRHIGYHLKKRSVDNKQTRLYGYRCGYPYYG